MRWGCEGGWRRPRVRHAEQTIQHALILDGVRVYAFQYVKPRRRRAFLKNLELRFDRNTKTYAATF